MKLTRVHPDDEPADDEHLAGLGRLPQSQQQRRQQSEDVVQQQRSLPGEKRNNKLE